MENRICSQCKVEKELNAENFYKNNRHKQGFLAACKVCVAAKSAQYRKDHPEILKARDEKRKADPIAYEKKLEMTRDWRARMKAEGKSNVIWQKHHLREKYNLTLEQYRVMLLEQVGVCAICKWPDPEGKALAVDHNHGTKENRGLLCGLCNKAIGLMKDSPELLQNAIDYLKKYN